MKKLLSFILLLTLSVTFTACGDDDEKEKFVWGGDWNDPNDPNYKSEYGGKYNPIQGLWRFDWDTERGIYFSEDLKIYSIVFYPSGSVYEKELWAGYYQINDKAYKENSSICRYKMEQGKLYYTANLNDDNNWGSLTKIEE